MSPTDKGAKCIVCGIWSEFAALTQINVRDKGQLRDVKYVHPSCYANDTEWVHKQVRGKNPKYFFTGREIK